jgi:hypothetical protein
MGDVNKTKSKCMPKYLYLGEPHYVNIHGINFASTAPFCLSLSLLTLCANLMAQYMKSFFLTIFIMTFSAVVIGQTDMYKEDFEFSYLPKRDGGQILYNGTKHSFTIDVVSDSINTTEFPNFIKVDGHIVQTTIVALPSDNLDLNSLTTDQQKEALEAYVDYELEYFDKELQLKYTNLKKEWKTIHTKLWLIWNIDIPEQKKVENIAQQVTAQIYASTICFNQILDINIPLFPADDIAKSDTLLIQLMSTLKTYNHRQF